MDAALGAARLGFGVSGPHATRLVSPETTAALICAAAEAGVRVFDTAPFYGDGEAERRLGLALTQLDRDTVTISTKVGTIWRGLGRAEKNFDPAFVQRSFFASLKRLNLDRLDLFQLHGPAPEALTPALLEILTGLKAAGWVNQLGVCVRGGELEPALDAQIFDVVMAPVRADLDIAHPKLPPLLERARAQGLMVIGIEALAPAGRRPVHLDGPGLWRLAKAFKSGAFMRPRRMTATQALSGAFATGLADVIMTTTTRRAHLTANLAVARTVASAPVKGSSSPAPKPVRDGSSAAATAGVAIGRGETA